MKQFLTFILFFFISGAFFAQHYQFKAYKVEEGLSSNETFDILQDKKNRIWVASAGGVSSFNGQYFTNYTPDDGLVSNICFSIFEDSKGRIWVGSLNNGVSIIENGKITNPKGVDFKLLGSVTSFLEDKDGTIYIFFTDAILTYRQGEFEILYVTPKESESVKFQSAAWFDANTIYVASTTKGIFKITLDPFKVENIYNQQNGVNNICYTVFVDDKKNIWVGGYGELNKISDGILTNYKFKPEDFDKNRFHGIYQENENELFLCTEGNGIGLFNIETGELNFINEAQGLPSKYVYSSIKDTEGNHWMTSFGGGIIRFRDTSFKIYNDTQGLPSKSVNSVVEWNGELIVATDKGIVELSKNGDVKPLIKNTVVKGLLVTPENNLFYLTDKDARELSKDGTQKIIDRGAFNMFYVDSKNTFLFGSGQMKVFSEDSTYTINTMRPIDVKPLADRYILCKISGLYQFKDGKVDSIPGLDYMKHNNFRSIDAISENEIIAGNEKKLYYIKFENNDFQIKTIDLNPFKELFRLRALKVDGDNLWLASRDLFMKIDLPGLIKEDTIIAKSYKTVAHFLQNEADLNSLYITEDKTVIVTSLDGMLTFNEIDFIPNSQPPKLDVDKILLFAEPLDENLYKSANGDRVLSYQENYLTFHMQAITFTNPENVRYKYRMIGLRDGNEWSNPTKDPKVVFSYLPPGNYTFEFTADNGDGIWQQTPYKYTFNIKIPFWRTLIFWFALIAFLSICVFIYYHFRTKSEKKRNEIYTHNLIKAQEEERTRVARELHDSVGQKLMLLTKKTKAADNPEMEFLASNTLEELRAISRGLHPAILERLGPTTAIKNMIDEVDNNTNIFFTHEIENIDSLLSKEASLHLYRIIQEVLNNMVKHADAKVASLSIEKKAESIEVTISDNGKGFVHAETIKSNKSLGMKTLYERAKILNSKLDFKSQQNKGTVITLSIPI